MGDEDTRLLWDHITGECFEGTFAGEKLEVWPIRYTTVAALAQQHPKIRVIQSNHRSVFASVMKAVAGRDGKIEGSSMLPPGFRRTMSGEPDPRLPELTQGLGVIVGETAKYYPMASVPEGGEIEDTCLGRPIRIERSALDGVPFARWFDDGAIPMQLLTRWYGFSFTYPGCEIGEDGAEVPVELTSAADLDLIFQEATDDAGEQDRAELEARQQRHDENLEALRRGGRFFTSNSRSKARSRGEPEAVGSLGPR